MTSKPKRRIVVRGRRRYTVCGPAPRPSRYFWIPGVTLLAVVLFSAYVVGLPAPVPQTSEPRAIAAFARYSFDDLASGMR